MSNSKSQIRKTPKVALVTGGGRGIGRGIVCALADNGWSVVVNYQGNKISAEETFDYIRSVGGEGLVIQADISKLDDRQRLIEDTLKQFTRLDLLVNNAGIAPRQRLDILEVGEESYDEVLAVNLRGPFFLTQQVAREMIDLIKSKTIESPRIVNISSISAYTSSPNRGEYCLSKAGMSMMTALFADRLAAYGIGVYEIRPGLIQTDMTKTVKAKYDRLIKSNLTPIMRWGQPDDVAKAVVAIAEGYLPFSTGEIINVDGGFHMRRL